MAVPRSSRGRWIFIDTSAYLAILDEADEYHAEATNILRSLTAHRYRQFVTNTLLIEAHAAILAALGIPQATHFLRAMEASSTTVVRTRPADEQRAKEIIFLYQDKDFSFTDAISFAVMERLRIDLAFTFDRHFTQFGFTQVTVEHLRT